jgi:hypothetical protein
MQFFSILPFPSRTRKQAVNRSLTVTALVAVIVFHAAGAEITISVQPVQEESNNPQAAPWEMALRKNLQLRLTVNLADAPLQGALDVLRNISTTPIILDPRAKASQARVSVTTKNETVGTILERMLRQAGLSYDLRDEAVFVFRKGTSTTKSGVPQAALTSEQAAELDKAIAGLSSPEFNSREKASQFIAGLGPACTGRLQDALAGTTDSEAHERIRELIAAFETKPAFPEPPEVTSTLDSFDECVNIEGDTAGLTDLMAKKGIQFQPEDLAASVNFTVRQMRLGNAIRWLVRLSDAKLIVTDKGLKVVKIERKGN